MLSLGSVRTYATAAGPLPSVPAPATFGGMTWSREQSWALFAVFMFGVALASNYTNHASLLPILMAELGFGPASAGLISGALFVAVALGQIAGGPLCDRYGTRRVGAAGLFLAAASTLALAGATGLAELIGLKTLTGLGTGVASCAGARFSGLRFRAEQSHATVGLYGGSIGLGGGLAVYAMPVVASLLDWRSAFVVAAMAGSVVALLWTYIPDAAGGRAANPLGAVRHATPWLLGVINLTTCTLTFVVGTWVTLYLVAEHGLPLITAGAVGSLVLTFGLLMRPLGGELSRRRAVTTRLAMRGSVAATLAGLLIMAAPGRPLAVAVLGILLVAFGVNFPYSAIYTTAPKSLPAAPGAALGLSAAVGSLGSVPLMTLIGWLYAATGGFVAPFVALAAVVLVGVGAAMVVPGAEDFPAAPTSR